MTKNFLKYFILTFMFLYMFNIIEDHKFTLSKPSLADGDDDDDGGGGDDDDDSGGGDDDDDSGGGDDDDDSGGGGLNDTSTNSINLISNPVVKISYLDDIDFGTWTGNGDIERFDDLCVYSNNGGDYFVKATGNGPGNSFKLNHLDSGNSSKATYEVKWNDQASAGGVSLTSGVQLGTAQSGAHQTKIDCRGGSQLKARVTVTFLESELETISPGNYEGTLTIQISAI